MKKSLTAILILLCVTAYAQEKNLPPQVQSAFQLKYADIKISEWWMENELFYLDFTCKGISCTAVYNQEGSWLETASIISELDIPQSMKDFIKKTFPSAKISYCEEVEKPEKKKIIRVNLIDSGNVFRVICCDQEGKHIVIEEPAS